MSVYMTADTSLEAFFRSPAIEPIVDFVISRRLKPEIHHPIIQMVANNLQDTWNLKKALFYLEYEDWDVGHAILREALDLDDADASRRTTLPDRIRGNPDIDRRLYPSNEFDPSLFNLEIMVGGEAETHRYFNSTDLNPALFDANDPAHMAALNTWRHQTIRSLVGLPRTTWIYKGEVKNLWHPLEESLVLNYYAAQDIDNEGPRFVTIQQQLQETFEGMVLPGRIRTCGARDRNVVRQLLVVKYFDPPGTELTWINRQTWDVRHRAAQLNIRLLWEHKLDVNEQRDLVRFGQVEIMQ